MKNCGLRKEQTPADILWEIDHRYLQSPDDRMQRSDRKVLIAMVERQVVSMSGTDAGIKLGEMLGKFERTNLVDDMIEFLMELVSPVPGVPGLPEAGGPACIDREFIEMTEEELDDEK